MRVASLHVRNRTCQGLDRQGQGQGPAPLIRRVLSTHAVRHINGYVCMYVCMYVSLQGPGQGQGLDLGGQGQRLKFGP